MRLLDRLRKWWLDIQVPTNDRSTPGAPTSEFVRYVQEAVETLPESLRRIARQETKIGVAGKTRVVMSESDKQAVLFGRCYTWKYPWGRRSKIVIYQASHETYVAKPLLPLQVKRTLIHELGHHIGLDHDEMKKYGF